MSVGPCDGAVPVLLGVIAVPCGRAIVSLGIIVVAVTMSAHIEQLVFDTTRSLAIELGHLVLEALPLSQIFVGMKSGVGGICAIDETKVGGHEIKCARIGRGHIL